MTEPAPHELSERLARLEARMQAMEAEFTADSAGRGERRTGSIDGKQFTIWYVGTWIVAIVVYVLFIR